MTSPGEGLKTRWVGMGLAAFFAIAGFSQARVQVFERKKILEQAETHAHFDLEKTEPATRGTIYSSDGKVLAESQDNYELGLNYSKIPQNPALFVSLSESTGIPATELGSPPKEVKGRVWRTPLSVEQATQIRAIKRKWSADGVSLERSNQRSYPLADVMAGIVGVARNGEAIAGLEKSLDEPLKGTNGEYRGFVDRSGTFLVDRKHPQKKRANGSSVVLTIDSSLQTAAMQSLKHAVEINKAKSGCALVYDPTNGDILAMANWPSFDPESSWNPGDDFNMAYMGAYEPGSTFKILTLAKGLDDQVIHEDDHFNCVGQITVSGKVLHCADHHGHRSHGDCDLTKAIAKSCNTAAATWAMKIGSIHMTEFMDRLSLFDRTDLGLPFERKGTFNRNDYAKKLQVATVGFGQSMNCVPVNLVAAYSIIANHGLMMKPRLIKSINGEETKVEQKGQMVKAETADRVLEIMKSVIQSDIGTGKSLKIPGYQLAGKTGTAQKIGTAQGQYVSNFVGIVPAQNPRAVVLVMVDSPSAGKYYGADVAGPVFVDISKSVIRRYGIPPSTHYGR